ncbi:MAG: DUF1598 domain-containing protein, partial [Planctomycetota bacterium]
MRSLEARCRQHRVATRAVLTLTIVALGACTLLAQQPPGGSPPNLSGVGGNVVGGGQGGAANADFDSLIDLIQSTVAPDSWLDNGTGEGDLSPFVNGVFVDVDSASRVSQLGADAELGTLLAARIPANRSAPLAANVRAPSELRFVSLNRLESEIEARQRQREPLDREMLVLAGLRRIAYVAVLPDSGDVVLAGPAGDWSADAEGRLVAVDTGRPIVRLDDLLVLWRQRRATNNAPYGCSIVPRQEHLARTQRYVAASARSPLEPGGRGAWLDGLREALGEQDVEFYNLSPETRVAQVLLHADYHMKLIGMGLAKGVPGVKSYLSTVKLGPGGTAPPMAVLRWWFSIPANEIASTADRDAFALPKRCVEVLSENEMLAARGKRVHTGASE